MHAVEIEIIANLLHRHILLGYKDVRGSDFAVEVKAVMSAYSDYYEFVVNVSGSFKSYSADKETLKKELASALKDWNLKFNAFKTV